MADVKIYTRVDRSKTAPVSVPEVPVIDGEIPPVINPNPVLPLVPPVAKRYASEAAMIADQANQLSGYLYFDGGKTWWYLGAGTGVIGDYEEFGGGGGSSLPPVDDSYASQSLMIADQANQTGQYIYFDGNQYWEYLGTTAGSISDYRAFGSLWTAGSGFIYRDNPVVIGKTTLPTNATFAIQSKTTISSHKFFTILDNSEAEIFNILNNKDVRVFGNLFKIGEPTTNSVDVTFKSRYSGSGNIWFRLLNSSDVVLFEATGTRINIPGQVNFGSLTANVVTTFSTQYAGSGNHILDMSSGFGANVFRFTATGNLIHTGKNLLVGNPLSPDNSGSHFKSLFGVGSGSARPAFTVDNGDDLQCFMIRSDRQIVMAGLPTSDPGVVGSLWNDSGTVKISL